jgi:hypothetical protein
VANPKALLRFNRRDGTVQTMNDPNTLMRFTLLETHAMIDKD